MLMVPRCHLSAVLVGSGGRRALAEMRMVGITCPAKRFMKSVLFCRWLGDDVIIAGPDEEFGRTV